MCIRDSLEVSCCVFLLSLNLPAGVLSWSLLGVDRGGWDVFGVAVFGESDSPAVVVEGVVVEVADEDAVFEVGGSSVCPAVSGVVGFAPIWWPVTARECAAAVSPGECCSLVFVEDSGVSA